MEIFSTELFDTFKNITCNIDKSLTHLSIIFVIGVFVFTIIAFIIIRNEKHLPRKMWAMSIGVLIFEVFTAPMWDNMHFGKFGYIYKDVTWILSLAWISFFLLNITLVDKYFSKLKEWQRLLINISISIIVVFLIEVIIVNWGMRGYAPEVRNNVIGLYIFNVPLEFFYYVPVFSALIITFYKYWVYYIDNKLLLPINTSNRWKNLALTTIAVLLFELMINPIVENRNFPEWSYVYQDVSIILTGIWILIITFTVSLVDKFLRHLDLFYKFAFYITIGGMIFVTFESWAIRNGYRIYSQSAVNNFIGIDAPIFGVPIEVIAAVPMYLALIIGFIRYWRIILDNKL